MPLLTRRNIQASVFETHQRFMLQVDWEDNGLETNDDVSSRVVGPVRCIRGRDYASQLTGRTVAGVLRCILRNHDGAFSSFLTSGPLYSHIRPNLKVQAMALAPHTAVLWTGFIKSLIPISAAESPTGEPAAELTAVGIFQRLGDQTNLVSPPPQTGVLTSDVVEAILDAAGIEDYDVEAGAVPIDHWFARESLALGLLQEMADETELGWAKEGLAFDVVVENRYHRMLESGTSQVTFSDDPASEYPYIAISQADSLREIYNRIRAQVTDYEAQALGVLWTLTEEADVYLAPGASRTFLATINNGYVDPWTTPAVATDVVGTGGTLAVSNVEKAAQTMTFTVTNSHVSEGSYLSTVQARGVLYDPADAPVLVESQDATSQTKYGKRTYPLPSPHWSSAVYAQAAADYFISRQKDPHPVITLAFDGTSNNGSAASVARFQTAVTLALSDRVTVEALNLLTMLGIEQDFFVESIEHEFGAGLPFTTRFLLSPADVQTTFWQLDVSELDTETVLAF